MEPIKLTGRINQASPEITGYDVIESLLDGVRTKVVASFGPDEDAEAELYALKRTYDSPQGVDYYVTPVESDS